MSELMSQGLNLALVGMGVVFSFLAILVFLTTLMSDLVARLPGSDASSQAPTTGVSPTARGNNGTPATTDSTQLVAVISAAIREHRRRR
ncbi:MAG: OadG family protein [Pseudomonadota bacterium]